MRNGFRKERSISMYEVRQSTKKIKGLVDLTMDNTKENAVELAAAWGLFGHKKLREGYTIKNDKITFRMARKTFNEWVDIIKSVREE